jgi:hypothetical protein
MTLDELQRRAQSVINGQRSYMSRQDAEAVLELVQKVEQMQIKSKFRDDLLLRFEERFLMIKNIIGDW